MAGPLVTVLGSALMALLGTLLRSLVRLAVRLVLWYSIFKLADFDLWWKKLVDLGMPSVAQLALPAWNEAITPYIAAADAWVPIAEMFVLFKLYWTGVLSGVPFRLANRLRGSK